MSLQPSSPSSSPTNEEESPPSPSSLTPPSSSPANNEDESSSLLSVSPSTKQADPTTEEKPDRLLQTAQVTKDLLPHLKTATSLGFSAATLGTSFGFSIAQNSLKFASYGCYAVGGVMCAAGAATAGPIVVASGVGLYALNRGTDFAKDITLQSQNAIKSLSLGAIDTVNGGLDVMGVVDGEGMKMVLGEENYGALSFVNGLIQEFKEDFPGSVKKREIYQAMAQVSVVHANEEVGLPKLQDGVEVCDGELWSEDVVRYVRFAVGVYGDLPTRFLGVRKAVNANGDSEEGGGEDEDSDHHIDVKMFLSVTSLPQNSIITYDLKGSIYSPGYVLTLDKKTKSLVVVVRGTIRIHDALTDLYCACEEYTPPSSTTTTNNTLTLASEEKEGAHQGMLISAHKILTTLSPIIQQTLANNSGYRLVITGHSLGAGVATILGTLIGSSITINEHDIRDVKVLAYAPPCTLTLNTSRACSSYIKSIVVGGDVVSRFGIRSSEDLRDEVLAAIYANNEDLVPAPAPSIKKSSKTKLYPGGRVLWLKSKDNGDETYEADNSVFERIGVRGGMFNDHMPQVYLREVERRGVGLK